ncbi:MAG: ribulose-phosphate 3-epimerase [Candidatus Roizmanbacteria bacterium]|nr:ribulose-phosphate 3-epimerase [Candidatus Roizmanbacteria bacterium]
MNSKKIEVIPGIFEKDFSKIERRAKLVSPFVDWIQIDIADNKLVPNNSLLDPEPFRKLISETNVNYELHMMIEDPFSVDQQWIDVGFKRLLFHVESFTDFSMFHKRSMDYKKQGLEIGLAIDKQTPFDVVFPHLDKMDCILIMTIAAGFSGQRFIPELLDKVRAVRSRKSDLPIEVDGGINDETAKLAIAAGANRLVSTSFIFNSENIGDAIEKLRSTPK